MNEGRCVASFAVISANPRIVLTPVTAIVDFLSVHDVQCTMWVIAVRKPRYDGNVFLFLFGFCSTARSKINSRARELSFLVSASTAPVCSASGPRTSAPIQRVYFRRKFVAVYRFGLGKNRPCSPGGEVGIQWGWMIISPYRTSLRGFCSHGLEVFVSTITLSAWYGSAKLCVVSVEDGCAILAMFPNIVLEACRSSLHFHDLSMMAEGCPYAGVALSSFAFPNGGYPWATGTSRHRGLMTPEVAILMLNEQIEGVCAGYPFPARRLSSQI
ncbi:hypothetical protein PCH_Pc13g04240 [Penicillium rubens Wisconsin 54-1255]|uniref:Uncharacterized protein n=1 Tax=Penicillium rubens (strain ATCC 28089 / DSM 1075 / NRRL 1951 / Wisconsin 54-1255) TaxID=500485 RepID=B6H273_PENRW|nr:hypothetical protein PCH_Pc13g04240 [Penicillium rubens Wisconsin 54-1255]